MAGMIDCFQGLGQRLLAEGYSNPFLNLPVAFMHADLASVHTSLASIASRVAKEGVPPDISPLVFAFTGSGNVTQGAREIFNRLPHQDVTVEELKTLKMDVLSGKRSRNQLYAVSITAAEMVRLKSVAEGGSVIAEGSNSSFDKSHYYNHPEEYVGTFHDSVAPHISVLVNGMYWEPRFPRLLTKQHMQQLWEHGKGSGAACELKVVADITCDLGGSVEFLTHSTPIEAPFFTYQPSAHSSVDGVHKDGVLVLGVDILPSELPRDASHHFSNSLISLLPPLLTSTGAYSSDPLADLPPE